MIAHKVYHCHVRYVDYFEKSVESVGTLTSSKGGAKKKS